MWIFKQTEVNVTTFIQYNYCIVNLICQISLKSIKGLLKAHTKVNLGPKVK
jgi:hypothetical protein